VRRPQAQVDLAAVRHNVEVLRRLAAPAEVMAVVKADGYGHGVLPVARAALEAGATWLGVATAAEALELRDAGVDAPLLAWLLTPRDDWEALVAAGVDVGVGALWALDAAVAAGKAAGRPAAVHLEVDSGLGRAGAMPAEWEALVAAAAAAQGESLDVVAVWSHLAYADQPNHPTIEAQRLAFERAVELARAGGLAPRLRHLANSAATLARPDTHYELVRAGIAVYGLSPGPQVGSGEELGLRPAMRLSAPVALAKRAPAGHGVSYAHRYVTERETTLALVPLGYADGIPRAATNRGPMWLAGRRRTIAGTVCMDQLVLDVGDDAVAAGDEVVVFGPGADGEPTAQDWAEVLDTINYEIVTRVGARVPRSYVDGTGA
jgi:alanine racemase